MNSEMRVTDAMVRAFVDSLPAVYAFDAPPPSAVRAGLEAAISLLARTEAGPSLLCQSDACAHKGTVHNFCTPRTEAGADAVREALAGQTIYLMGREHINEDRKPLAELVYGMTVPGTGVLFCMKDTGAAIPKDAEPVAEAGADGADLIQWRYTNAGTGEVLTPWTECDAAFREKRKGAPGYQFRELFAHPQDASGDADVAVAALREIYETGMYPEGHTLAGEHAYKGEYHADCIGIAERALAAMQAKEAK